jgi:prepilin-type N-terminal cleavage/methylation domain-containing protein
MVRLQRRDPNGFTLLELILVLTVIVVAGSIAILSISGLLESRRVRRAGELVRNTLAQARLEAMREGRTHTFRCHYGTDEFAVEPYVEPTDLTEAADQIGRGAAAVQSGGMASAAVTSADAMLPTEIKRLPEGTTFAASQSQSQSRTMQGQMAMTATAEWSQPIMFFADGTTSTAEVVVTNASDFRIGVRLRGITGDAMMVQP